MSGLGRFVIDGEGVILSADARFGITMRLPIADLIGCNILDFTAPADRETCIALMGRMLGDGEPVATTKRLIRGDGSHMWIFSMLDMASAVDGDVRVDCAIEESAPPSDWVDPSALLHLARFVFDARRLRSAGFSGALFSDHAWDILLAAYISEAEGRALTTADLHATIGLSLVNASRWMRALSADGLIEYEAGGSSALVTGAFRLTGEGHRRFERYLSDLYGKRRVHACDMENFER